MIHGLLLSDDLIFASRITTTARAHGLQMDVARTMEQCIQLMGKIVPTGVILDLHNETLQLDSLVSHIRNHAANTKIIGYGSHVDKVKLQAARDAGIDAVLPRSKFVNDLESSITDWLTPHTND